MEQFVLIPASLFEQQFKQEKTTSTLPLDNNLSPEEEKNPVPTLEPVYKELTRRTKSKQVTIIDHILQSPRIKLSLSHNLILDGVDTGVSLVDFVHQLKKKSSSIPSIYFTLLEAIKLDPSLVHNKNAKARNIGSWLAFQI